MTGYRNWRNPQDPGLLVFWTTTVLGWVGAFEKKWQFVPWEGGVGFSYESWAGVRIDPSRCTAGQAPEPSAPSPALPSLAVVGGLPAWG